jgi:hypothetical protein
VDVQGSATLPFSELFVHLVTLFVHGWCRWDAIMDVMDLIEKESVLSPLQVKLLRC